MWIKAAQTQLAGDSGFEKLKRQFNLFQDRGVWRCGGRLANADIPFQEKHPVLLPRNHHLASLIVREAHERVFHNGVKDTLTEVRSRFWILKGRALIRKMVHQCINCKKSEGKSYLGPSPPPLPEFRVKQDPPFTYTRVDFAGPLYVHTSSATVSGKVWICLYTCCVVRAVHLDIYCTRPYDFRIHSQYEALLGTTRSTEEVLVRQRQNLQGSCKGDRHHDAGQGHPRLSLRSQGCSISREPPGGEGYLKGW